MGEPPCLMHLLDEEGRMPEPRVKLRRAYEAPAAGEGRKVLVDRVWPRGVSKASLQPDLWLREVAPSTELRKWFDHRRERWDEFRRRYREELRSGPAHQALDQLVELARRGPVVLLFGARDPELNQATVLREMVEERLSGG
jgi:uncharacterized protein YeaO (DUF488 family)